MFGAQILVVDDDEHIRNLMRELVRNLGYDPLMAASGDEAVRLAKERQPHMIITDVQMPGMDGVELNMLLCLEPSTKDIPILIMTGDDHKHIEIALGYPTAVKFEYILSKKSPLPVISAKIKEIMEKYYQL